MAGLNRASLRSSVRMLGTRQLIASTVFFLTNRL